MVLHELPVDPDQGFPQRFLVAISGASYDVQLYANVAGTVPRELPELLELAPPDQPTEPSAPPAFLVLTITRRTPPAEVLLRRKVVVDPGLVHEAHELAVVVHEARIARDNLNGRARRGSRVVIGVGRRWA